MTWIPFSKERFLFGNVDWRSHRAIREINVYCDLIEMVQGRIDSLESRGREEEIAFRNVQAVLSSYVLEVTMKSFWALDNPAECVPHTHHLPHIYEGFKEETKRTLAQYQLVKELFDRFPEPFFTNRYSMEGSTRDVVSYPVEFLRSLNLALKQKLEESTGWTGYSED